MSADGVQAGKTGRTGVRWAWRSSVAILAVAALVGGVVAVREQVLKRAALEELGPALLSPTSGPGTVRVVNAVRELKLVTVAISTFVNSESGEESWRGDVHAKIGAPVKLHFGTDLSQMESDSVRIGPLGDSWIVTVPAPKRIATEVFGQLEKTDVEVGWMRSKSMAGEKHLGLARQGLYPAARRLELSADDEQRVRALTREQVGTLVQSIVGGPIPAVVTVRFDDEVRSTSGRTSARADQEQTASGVEAAKDGK